MSQEGLKHLRVGGITKSLDFDFRHPDEHLLTNSQKPSVFGNFGDHWKIFNLFRKHLILTIFCLLILCMERKVI